MTKAQVALPDRLIPVFAGEADVRGSYGGRGSGKTRSFAKMTAIRAYMWDKAGREGIVLCGRQFMNSLDDSSLEEVKAAISSEEWLLPHFEIGDKYIKTKSGRISYKFAGLDRNVSSVKSKSRILLCWVDEAEPVEDAAWSVLIPTLREEDSELWVTWNPERKGSATDKRFRDNKDPRVKVSELNWRDNPRFPMKLERDRQRDLEERPDSYEHVWEGAYKTVVEGAYYVKDLTQARAEGRIGKVPVDPLMTIRLMFDIGGTGAKADACAIWVCQFVGMETRLLDYYEAVGQPLATHLNWMRGKGYTSDKAQIWLPHDGASNDKVFDVSYQSALQAAGYTVTVVPNQGKGAATARIEAGRRMFSSCWFNQETTQAGIDALGCYHEKRDEKRNIGLGPAHDWASHCFVGSTEVITRAGVCRLDQLSNVGEVLTSCGWKLYRNPRVTRANAPLVEVMFKDGSTVRCTPEHLFLTDNGWKSAESLQMGSLIQSTLTPSLSISMVAYTVCGLLKAIYREVGKSCTGMFGNLRLGKFLRGVTYTTRTAISSITGFQTLSVCLPQSTCRVRGMNQSEVLLSTSPLRQEGRPRSGINQKPEGFGINVMQSGRNVGQSGSESPRIALSAVRSSMRLFAKAVTRRFIAQGSARLLHIESVLSLDYQADVWCMTVPDGEMFSLANGAVVHNCGDAFGLIAVVPRSYHHVREEDLYPEVA